MRRAIPHPRLQDQERDEDRKFVASLLRGAKDLRLHRVPDDEHNVAMMVSPGPGVNLAIFHHGSRLTCLLMYASKKYVKTAAEQVCDALVYNRILAIKANSGYSYLLLNPSAPLLVSVLSIFLAPPVLEFLKTIAGYIK